MEDIVNVGDEIVVKVIEIDEQGRLNLSRKDALIQMGEASAEDAQPDAPRRSAPRAGGFRRDRNRDQRRD